MGEGGRAAEVSRVASQVSKACVLGPRALDTHKGGMAGGVKRREGGSERK